MTRGRGLESTTRKTWILSRNLLGTLDRRIRDMVDSLPEEMPGSRHLSKPAIEREHRWINETVSFLEARNVLNADAIDEYPKIINLGTGCIAPDSVNINHTVTIGNKILSIMNGLRVDGDFKWSRKDCVTQMPPKSRIQITNSGKQTIKRFDTVLAIQRLMVNFESIPDAFCHELCDEPPALFAHGVMRDAGKARLSRHLCDTMGKDAEVTMGDLTDYVSVYDGGMLIQQMLSCWSRGSTMGEIVDNYASHLTRQSRDCQEIVVVMDGYREITTKSYTQRKRNPTCSLEVAVQRSTVLDVSPTVFLSNSGNKQSFVDLLSDKINLTPRLRAVKHTADADCMIVTTALDTLKRHKPVLIRSDDTDVLVLCLTAAETQGLFLKRGCKVYNSEKFQAALGPLMKTNLLVLHGFFGNDTVSSFYSHPSSSAVKKKWDHLSQELAIFKDETATKEEIHAAGMKLVATTYRCSPELNAERVRIFKERCNNKSSKKQISLERLPPTEDAAKLHSERAYLQVQEWLGNRLDPTSFGWVLRDGILDPIPMLLKPAPESLMEIKKCGCSTGCRGGRCGCYNGSLWCTDRCSCTNCENQDDKDVIESDCEIDDESDTDGDYEVP